MSDDLLPDDPADLSLPFTDATAGVPGGSGAELVPADVARALDCLGLRVVAPVGTEGTGWLGESVDGRGTRAELHVVPAVVDDELAARADLLRALTHEHLARVHDVLEIAPGRLALVVEHVEGPTLRELRTARAPLSDPEAAGVAIALAGALEALHAAGTAHGAVSATSIRVRADGSPVLVDLRGSLLGSGSASGDVGRLVAAVLDQMPDEDAHRVAGATGTLRDELVGLVGEPTSAAAVAVACLRVTHPGPLQVPDELVASGADGSAWDQEVDAPGPAVRRRARRPDGYEGPRAAAPPGRRGPVGSQGATRRPGARVLLVATAVVLVLGAGFVLRTVQVGRAEAAPGPAGTSPAPTIATGAPVRSSGDDGGVGEPRAGEAGVAEAGVGEASAGEAAAALTTQRGQVLASGDADQLATIEVLGSPAHTADLTLMSSLVGTRLEGYGVDVLEVAPVAAATDQTTETTDGEESGEGDEVRVSVTSAAREHVRTGPDGSTTVPATAPSTVVLVLHETADGWRVWDVEPAS
ncbi:hypothetical protein [Cellulomonas soli]